MKFCTSCGKPVVASVPNATTMLSTPVQQVTPAIAPPVVFLPNGDVKLDIHSASDAKVALKELKLKKKELSLAKRTATEEQREIRAAYTDHVRRQMPMIRGRSGLLGFARDV